MKPTLLVLAAGIGSRYGGVKQLDSVGPTGETLLDYAVYDAIRAGFGKVVFVISPDLEADFKATVGTRYQGAIDVAYAYQKLQDVPSDYVVPEGRKKPWGTAHAVLSAGDVIAEPFAVINADDFYGPSSYRFVADFLSNANHEVTSRTARYCMCGFLLQKTLSNHGSVSRGVCQIDDNGYLQSVNELTQIEKEGECPRYIDENGTYQYLAGDEIVSMNMWGFTPDIFGALHREFDVFLADHSTELKSEFLLPDVVTRLIDERKATVKVLHSHETWAGVTYPEDKPSVVAHIKELIAQGIYPQELHMKERV